MSSLSDRMVQTTVRLIEQYGAPATLLSVAEGAYDVATGISKPAATSLPCRVVFQPLRGAVLTQGLESNAQIGYLAAKVFPTPPRVNDKLVETATGIAWEIRSNSTYYVNEVAVLYETTLHR